MVEQVMDFIEGYDKEIGRQSRRSADAREGIWS